MTVRALDPLFWDDAYPIALLLKAAHPETDPLAVDFAVLREWVLALDAFADEPQGASLHWLEQIQVEWIELVQ
jgi:FeS assembly protein IscX